MGRAGWAAVVGAAAIGLAGCEVRTAEAETPRAQGEQLMQLSEGVGRRGKCVRDSQWQERLAAAQKASEVALHVGVGKRAHRESAAPDAAKLSWGARQLSVGEGAFAQAAWSADGHSHVFWFREDGDAIGNVAVPGSLSEPIVDERGNLYAVGVGKKGEGYVIAASPGASIRWARTLGTVIGSDVQPKAVVDGQLVLTDGRAFAINDGAIVCDGGAMPASARGSEHRRAH